MVHVQTINAVTGTDGIVLIVDGCTAEMPVVSKDKLLEAQLVGEFTRGNRISSNNSIQALAESRLVGWGT